MHKLLITYVRAISSFNDQIFKGLKWIVIVIIGLLLYETITRYVFNNPCIWSTELLMHLYVGGVILSGGYILLHGKHVRMDVFYSRWSPRTKAIFDVGTFFLFVYVGVMAFTGIDGAIISFNLGQHSASLWGPPWWPVKVIIAVGAIILLLQSIGVLIQDIATILGRPL